MLGEHLVAGEQLLGPDGDLNALEELSRTISSESQRASKRTALNSAVVVHKANASERSQWKLQGKVRDHSDSGCGIFTETPLGVGDLYWLQFEDPNLGGGVLARCVRCRMIGEGKFEQGMLFFDGQRRSGSASSQPLV